MFLDFLNTGNDPFEAHRDKILAYAENRPTLEFLIELWINWPSTFVFIGDSNLSSGGWPEIGVPRACGYRVGKSKPMHEEDRLSILRHIFLGEIPYVYSESHMREWGHPKSARRLRKLAGALASHCRNRKRAMAKKGYDYSCAIQQYEHDLEWLKDMFYTGGFQFRWASTEFRDS